MRDYYAIDPAFGTKRDLLELIHEAHRRSMRVILDIVANHTAWDSVLMEHPDFYKHDAHGKIAPPSAEWTDVAALDYGNPRVRTYMTGMLEYWLREFHIDGFRCDVAGLVPTDFWESTSVYLERIQPELVMLAEWDHPDLLRKAFDIDYSWPLYKTVKAVMAGHSPASEIRATCEEQERKFGPRALHMRFFDNHDEQRAVTLFGLDGARSAAVLMFSLDGVPLVYNGNEVGDSTESGGDAMFHRLKIFWPISARRPEFLPFFKELIALRRRNQTLQTGELLWIDHPASEHVVAFRRRSSQEEIAVAVNLSNSPIRFSLPEDSLTGFVPLFGNGQLGTECFLPPWGFQLVRKGVS